MGKAAVSKALREPLDQPATACRLRNSPTERLWRNAARQQQDRPPTRRRLPALVAVSSTHSNQQPVTILVHLVPPAASSTAQSEGYLGIKRPHPPSSVSSFRSCQQPCYNPAGPPQQRPRSLPLPPTSKLKLLLRRNRSQCRSKAGTPNQPRSPSTTRYFPFYLLQLRPRLN